MAEVVGLAASILTLGSAGLSLSLGLRNAIADICSATEHVHDIATSISLLSSTLRHVGQAINSQSSPHSCEALLNLREIMEHCEGLFDEVWDMLRQFRKNGSNNISLGWKIKYAFKRETVKYLIVKIESAKLTLCIMLEVFRLKVAIIADKQRIHESREHQDELAALRAQIQNLVLDRCWAEQNSNKTNETTAGQKSADNPKETVPRINRQALVGPQVKALTLFDQYIFNNSQTKEFSGTTMQRSTQAIDILLELWCISGGIYSGDMMPEAGSSSHYKAPMKELSNSWTEVASTAPKTDSHKISMHSEPIRAPRRMPSYGTLRGKNSKTELSKGLQAILEKDRRTCFVNSFRT